MIMEKKMKSLIAFILLSVLLCACAPQVEIGSPTGENQKEQNTMGEYKKISGDEASKMMSGDVVIIDARTQEEYEEGHVPNAVLLPYDSITADTAAAVAPD